MVATSTPIQPVHRFSRTSIPATPVQCAFRSRRARGMGYTAFGEIWQAPTNYRHGRKDTLVDLSAARRSAGCAYGASANQYAYVDDGPVSGEDVFGLADSDSATSYRMAAEAQDSVAEWARRSAALAAKAGDMKGAKYYEERREGAQSAADNYMTLAAEAEGGRINLAALILDIVIAAKFLRWHREEKKDLSWLVGLPDCPCCLPPRGSTWAPPTDANQYYHPKASKCIRSNGSNSHGAGQQCCYDDDFKLITGGPGAGTPDKFAPGWDVSEVAHHVFGFIAEPLAEQFGGNHQLDDVFPFEDAKRLGDSFEEKYREVRPPNNGNGCKENVK